MSKRYRYEIKYLISDHIAKILESRLQLIMDRDRHSIADDYSYFIRSLYYDTIDSDAYAEKVDGVQFRKKYRIRYYNQDPSFIKLECKHKHDQLTYKDVQRLTLDETKQILNEQALDLNNHDSLLQRFLLKLNITSLRPIIIVDYYRQAFVYEPLNVRVTLDYHVTSSIYNTDLFNHNHLGVPVFENNTVVLEVKFDDFMPQHISTILQTIPKTRYAISKFAHCRSIL